MTVKDFHSTSSPGTFKPRKVVKTLSQYGPILIFIYLSSWTGKASNSIFFKPSVLAQLPSYFCNSFS